MGFLGTDEICAASGRDRRAAYHPNEIASPQPIEMHPLPFARAKLFEGSESDFCNNNSTAATTPTPTGNTTF